MFKILDGKGKMKSNKREQKTPCVCADFRIGTKKAVINAKTSLLLPYFLSNLLIFRGRKSCHSLEHGHKIAARLETKIQCYGLYRHVSVGGIIAQPQTGLLHPCFSKQGIEVLAIGLIDDLRHIA